MRSRLRGKTTLESLISKHPLSDQAPEPQYTPCRSNSNGQGKVFADRIREMADAPGCDITSDESDLVYATQGPLAVNCFGDKISEAAWRSKPNWYIVAAQDETIPPAVERDSANRMGAETIVLESSHFPMLSQPDAVAEFIIKAATSL